MRVRERAKRATAWAKERAKRKKKDGKRSIVQVITSEKIIQALMTGAITGIVSFYIEGIAVYSQLLISAYTPFLVHAKVIGGTMLIGVFYAAYWADRHTEEFREWVEEATGEEASTDSADG